MVDTDRGITFLSRKGQKIHKEKIKKKKKKHKKTNFFFKYYRLLGVRQSITIQQSNEEQRTAIVARVIINYQQ